MKRLGLKSHVFDSGAHENSHLHLAKCWQSLHVFPGGRVTSGLLSERVLEPLVLLADHLVLRECSSHGLESNADIVPNA